MERVAISEYKQKQLRVRMEKLAVVEADLEEQFVRGSGKGGQKINKTSSCVVLAHKPSGILIKCQKERSQAMNRYFARRELCDRLEERDKTIRSEREQKREKVRRSKRTKSRRQKARMLEEKGRQGDKKQARQTVAWHHDD